MRHTGSASNTGDSYRASSNELAESERLRVTQTMRMCALTGEDFCTDISSSRTPIVACPYGRLYAREAALEALLRRKATYTNMEETYKLPELGWHISGWKDLHPVRFQTKLNQDGTRVNCCPVTGMELTGSQVVYLIVKTNGTADSETAPNVVSERAIHSLGQKALQLEYGPFKEDHMIRLAPSSLELTKMQERWEVRRRQKRKISKKFKKSKHAVSTQKGEDESVATSQWSLHMTVNHEGIANGSAVDIARKNIDEALTKSGVLAKLFVDKERLKTVTEKEKKDNLFVR